MEDFVKGVLPLVVVCGLLYFAYCSIKPLFKDDFAQYVIQRVDAPNGRGFCMVHNIGCAYYRQWYGREDKKEFVKHECYVYCKWCIDLIDAKQLNTISHRRWEEGWDRGELNDSEVIDTFKRMMHNDESERIYELSYVHDNGHSVHRATEEDITFYKEFIRNRSMKYYNK